MCSVAQWVEHRYFLVFLVVARAALLGRMHMGLQVDARFYRGCE